MRKMMLILLMLMLIFSMALASEPANPADPAMIAELLPGHTLVEGIDDGDELRLLMKRGDGALVFVGGVRGEEGSWLFTESTPLPEGTYLGVENFTHSLGIPSGTYYTAVNVNPYTDGTWGVSMVMPDASGLFNLGKHQIEPNFDSRIIGPFGDHPWNDISTIDWTTLPASYEEARAHLDSSDWAVVNNPNQEDRLHLRVSPDQDAASLGKYYNCTPVHIREYGSKWCAVTVCGLDGWMMTRYLAFGTDMDSVEYAGPWLTWKENLPEDRLYQRPCISSPYAAKAEPEYWPKFYILGVVEDFYHVWMPYTEEYGYIHMDDLWEGNG